jgi:hypothetical protein
MRQQERHARNTWTRTHLLKGKLRTFEGYAMSPGSVQRPISKRADPVNGNGRSGKRLVRYYVSQKAIKHGYKSCPIKTINAQHIDDLVRGLVLDRLRAAAEVARQVRAGGFPCIADPARFLLESPCCCTQSMASCARSPGVPAAWHERSHA